MSRLLTAKELASELNRSVHYIYQMRRRGFRMIGGRATLESAMKWLDKNPKPFGK